MNRFFDVTNKLHDKTYTGRCYSHNTFHEKIGNSEERHRINFIKSFKQTTSEDFCLNTVGGGIIDHMKKSKDIICVTPWPSEEEMCHTRSEIKDIEKVNNTLRN